MTEIKNTISSIKLAEYDPPDRIEKPASNGKWIQFGYYNDYPDYILGLYANSPTNHAVIDKMVQLIVGDGISSNVANGQEILNGLGINDILPMLTFDFYAQGGCYLEVIRNLKDEELEVNHLPFENCRLGYEDDNEEELNGIYYSSDWQQYRKAKYEPEFIPFYDPQTNDARSVIVIYRTSPGSKYYPSPTYQGAIDYVEAEIQIGKYHNNQLLNGLFPSFIVSFNNGIPDEDSRNKITRELERKISGAQNAGKFITLFNDPGSDNNTEFEPFPISDAADQYQFLTDLATDMVLRGHRVTSPIIFGVTKEGGFSNNANEMEEARRMLEGDVIFPDRKTLLKGLLPLLQAKGVIPSWDMERDEATSDSDLAYDQGQITQVLDIMTRVNAGTLTASQGRNLLTSLLGFDEEAALLMFPDEVALSDKKKVPQLTDEWGNALAVGLAEFGQTVDDLEADGWDLVFTEDAGSHDDEKSVDLDYILRKASESTELNLGSIYANPGERSEFGDSGLYKLRYRYSQNLSANSRGFCVDMVGLSKRGYIFRKEDIDDMSNNPAVNGQFAPQGLSTYDIFDWKGGVYCHHKWERLIFFRKRGENGKFLPPSPSTAKTERGMRNDKRVGNVPFVPQKGQEGVSPINTPSRGSLKNA